MTRVLLALVSFCALAVAQAPLVEAQGKTLETFDVIVRLEGVDRSSANTLARSFARFSVQERKVAGRFAHLYHAAHVEILKRYYQIGKAARQQKLYDRAEGRFRDYTCEVVGVKQLSQDKALATLRRSWLDVAAGKTIEREARLELKRKSGTWWIAELFNVEPGKGPVRQPVRPPPKVEPAKVPEPVAPDLSSPKAAVLSLKRDIGRLRLLRTRAQHAATGQHFFTILGTFRGEAAVRRARRERKAPPPSRLPKIEIARVESRPDGVRRVEVLVSELVPGTKKELWSAIGHAAFDFKQSDGRWRVAGELTRLSPTEPFVDKDRDFATLFLLGG